MVSEVLQLELCVKFIEEGVKLWISSFFERNLYEELVSSSYFGAYFESWVKFVDLLLP